MVVDCHEGSPDNGRTSSRSRPLTAQAVTANGNEGASSRSQQSQRKQEHAKNSRRNKWQHAGDVLVEGTFADVVGDVHLLDTFS